MQYRFAVTSGSPSIIVIKTSDMIRLLMKRLSIRFINDFYSASFGSVVAGMNIKPLLIFLSGLTGHLRPGIR